MAEHMMNAAVRIEACRAVLSTEGQRSAVDVLTGLEVLDTGSAMTAFGILRAIPVYGMIAQAAKQEALDALREVLESAPTPDA